MADKGTGPAACSAHTPAWGELVLVKVGQGRTGLAWVNYGCLGLVGGPRQGLMS